MGVTISKPAINIREKLTEASAVVPYEQRQFHFDGLVTNGTFDTNTDWTLTAAASISGGEMVITNCASGVQQYQSYSAGADKLVSYSFEVTDYTSGAIELFFHNGNGSIKQVSSTGTFSGVAVLPATTQRIAFRAIGTTTVTIDNISVYEADPSDNKVIHTMPKGWKPLHVYESGALQREGSAYDYTVEYDGFNYIVKETVAPVAPYSTTVIGVRA